MNIDFNRNEDIMKLALSHVKKLVTKIEEGGGKKAIAKQKERNKLTARERIQYLLDEKKPFIEIGVFAGYGMYEDYGGCPAGGTIAGIGYVSGKQCIIIANDQTVKAGAWFPITAKKNLRMQEISMENNLPVIYLVDSAGVFLPMQDEIFPDREHFGRVFRNNAKMSAMGITQIAAVMGPCVAGGAYLPIMSDETLMVEGNGSIFLAGPYLVKAAIGETTDNETLGGAITHTEISGIADYKLETEEECLDQVKQIMSKIGDFPKAGFNRIASLQPAKDPSEIYGFFPEGNTKPYDMLEIIERIVDASTSLSTGSSTSLSTGSSTSLSTGSSTSFSTGDSVPLNTNSSFSAGKSSFEQFKEGYGKTILCGYARIDGWAVGIVANQRLNIKNKKGELQMGGVIYNDSADKAARFIMNCNQKKIPLIFLQDVTGFMVGSRSEHSGIIKDGAKMVNAVANSVVPKITIILGNSYGAGNYAMCGKAYDPRFIYAWPSAKIAVMGGEQAAKTLLQIEVASLKAKGKAIAPENEEKLLAEMTDKYTRQTTPFYAASRLWVDAIIDPVDTRMIISENLSAVNNNGRINEFKTGVFQV